MARERYTRTVKSVRNRSGKPERSRQGRFYKLLGCQQQNGQQKTQHFFHSFTSCSFLPNHYIRNHGKEKEALSGASFPCPVSAGVFMMIPPGISHMPRRAVSLSGFPDAAFGVTDGGYARARREARARGSDSILHHKHRQPRQCTV